MSSIECDLNGESNLVHRYVSTKKMQGGQNLDLYKPFASILSVPKWFWKAKTQEASGFYYGNNVNQTTSERDSSRHLSIVRFLVKYGTRGQTVTTKPCVQVDYDWHKLTFVIQWRPPGNVVLLCFDLPAGLRDEIEASFLDVIPESLTVHPFGIHAKLLDSVVELYDSSVWFFRDVVRAQEHHRPTSENLELDYAGLHELARHVIHASEVSATALNVMGSMLHEMAVWQSRGSALPGVMDAESEIRHLKSLLECIHLRSKALEDRLKNEINLVRFAAASPLAVPIDLRLES